MFKQGPDFYFEISEVEITRVDCTLSRMFRNQFVMYISLWTLQMKMQIKYVFIWAGPYVFYKIAIFYKTASAPNKDYDLRWAQ